MTTLLDPSAWPTSIWILALTAAVFFAVNLFHRPSFAKGAPAVFEAYPIVGAYRFFTNRTAFLEGIAGASKTGQASFYYGKHRIIALSGDVGRRVFFESRDLDIDEGYATLFNATPTVKVDRAAGQEPLVDKLKRNLVKLMRKDVLSNLVPVLVRDASDTMLRLEAREEHIVDPFDDIYLLIYQMTMRTFGCTEIAGDPALLSRTLSLFEGIDSASAASKLLFPWLPSPSHMKRMWAGLNMYRIFSKIVEERKTKWIRHNDPLQMLIDHKEPILDIVGMVIAALFAGLINSGINAAWLLCFLGQNREWYDIIQKEVDTAISKRREDETQTPAEILSGLTVDEWEAEFPMIDVALKETIRLTITGCAFRANISGKDIKIGDTGEVIPDSVYAVYLFDDTEMNPDIYTDPTKWDPGRFLPGRAEDKKVSAHGFVGWGSGRHPCLGMRFAKLEMAVLIATFFAHFDFHLCDKQGNQLNAPKTQIDRETHQAVKPVDRTCLRYKVRV